MIKSHGTRDKSSKKAKFPKLYELLGNSSELCSSELPTLRQCLKCGLLLREISDEEIEIRDMCKRILSEVNMVWNKANARIKLVSEKYAIDKLVHEWETAKECTKRGAKTTKVSNFKIKLDKLFDLCKCKCKLFECSEKSCAGCKYRAHVDCKCHKEDKIPLMELGFMKSQRDKVGDRGSMQIGSKDVIETKKQARYLERKDYSSNPKRAKTNMGESSTTSGLDILDENEPLDESDNEGSDLSVDLSSTRDYTQNDVLDISKISLAAIRYDVSNRATAAISTATVAALKNVNLISEDVEIIIDHNKIRRSKHKVMKEQQMMNEQAIEASTIQGILFDGRKDTTKFMRLGVDGKLHPSEEKEEHISICSEPGGRYLCHFKVDSNERSSDQTAADQTASLMYEWIVDHGIKDSLLAIGGDSTNVNTGCWGGAIQFLEKK